MQLQIAEALLHVAGGHRVLGKRLRPFSLWHELVLEHLQSPFLHKNRPLLPEDLCTAVAVCGSAFPHVNVRLRTTPALLWRMAGGGFARELKSFLAYIGDYLTEPDFAVVQATAMESPGSRTDLYGQPPAAMAMAADIVAWSGWSREVVLNLPSGEARLWHAFTRKAAGQTLDWVDPSQENEMDALAKTNPELHASFLAAAEAYRGRKSGATV